MKKKVRKNKTRPPIDRMLGIHERIKAGKFPNAVKMGKDFEVTDRTVKNDILYMRNIYKAPIEFDVLRNGYFYTEEFDFVASLTLSEEDIFGLLVADKMISQYEGLPFQKVLRAVFKKFLGLLDKQELYSIEDLGDAISVRAFAPDDGDVEVFRALAHAVHECRVAEFDYTKPGEKKAMRRRVRPYQITLADSTWYLFAYDLMRQDIRTFTICRVTKPLVTDEQFPKVKFDPRKYLKDSFTVMRGKENHKVVIEFDALATDYVRIKKWHASQKLKIFKNGRSRMEMRLNSLEEVERWILGWKIHARVIGPAPLRERIKESIAGMAKMYAGKAGSRKQKCRTV